MEVRPDQWMDGDETLGQHPPMDGWGWGDDGGGSGLLSVLADVVDIDVGEGLQHVDIKGTDALHPPPLASPPLTSSSSSGFFDLIRAVGFCRLRV